MKINYCVFFIKELNEDEIQVKHTVYFEAEPGKEDITHLIEELATDEEFGMVGDDDYEIYVFPREEAIESLEIEIPKEINEDEYTNTDNPTN